MVVLGCSHESVGEIMCPPYESVSFVHLGMFLSGKRRFDDFLGAEHDSSIGL